MSDDDESYVFTHAGWFGICPVYLGNLETEVPVVIERHPSLRHLFALSEYFQQFRIWFWSVVKSDYEPVFTFHVTGELVEPFVR